MHPISTARRLVAVLALAVVPASASTIVFSDKSSWENSVAGLVTFNYEGPAPGTTVQYTSSAGVPNTAPFTIVGYSDGAPLLFGTQGDPSHWWYNWRTGAILRAPDNNDDTQKIRVTYAAGTTAIGLYLMSINPQAANVKVVVNGTDTYTVPTQTNPTPTWWGITGTTPITFAEFQSLPRGSALLVDYISAGHAPADTVPESSAFLMTGGGLLVLGGVRRRRGSGEKP